MNAHLYFYYYIYNPEILKFLKTVFKILLFSTLIFIFYQMLTVVIVSSIFVKKIVIYLFIGYNFSICYVTRKIYKKENRRFICQFK